MSNQQLWQWVHQLYGSQLGLTASDDDYEPPDSNQESDNAYTPDMVCILAFTSGILGVRQI